MQRRLSDPLDGRFDRDNEPLPFYPSPVIEDTKYGESKRSAVDRNIASTVRTSPVKFDPLARLSPESMVTVCCTT
jgi:hypothetical protein